MYLGNRRLISVIMVRKLKRFLNKKTNILKERIEHMPPF